MEIKKNDTVPDPIDVLIDLLRLIDSNEDIDIEDKRFVHPLVEAVVYLADECLTIDHNYPNIRRLRDAGFDVRPAEQDSFGWLTGWIELNKREGQQILFG